MLIRKPVRHRVMAVGGLLGAERETPLVDYGDRNDLGIDDSDWLGAFGEFGLGFDPGERSQGPSSVGPLNPGDGVDGPSRSSRGDRYGLTDGRPSFDRTGLVSQGHKNHPAGSSGLWQENPTKQPGGKIVTTWDYTPYGTFHPTVTTTSPPPHWEGSVRGPQPGTPHGVTPPAWKLLNPQTHLWQTPPPQTDNRQREPPQGRGKTDDPMRDDLRVDQRTVQRTIDQFHQRTPASDGPEFPRGPEAEGRVVAYIDISMLVSGGVTDPSPEADPRVRPKIAAIQRRRIVSDPPDWTP